MMAFITTSTGKNSLLTFHPYALLQNLLGLITLVVMWQLLAMLTHDVVVASPWETFLALSQLIISGTLFEQLFITMGRLLRALGIGIFIGASLGFSAGSCQGMRNFLEPIRWVTMTVPPIIIAVLGMLWLGMGSQQVIFLVAFVVTPVVYINTIAGIDSIDNQLLEMGQIYNFSRWQMMTQIFLPGIAPSLIAGFTLAVGIGIRAVILAELLGAFEGVGHRFNRAWTYLKTPDLFAWIIASLLMMTVIEIGLLYPLRKYFFIGDRK